MQSEDSFSLYVSIFSCIRESLHCDLTVWLSGGNIQATEAKQEEIKL